MLRVAAHDAQQLRYEGRRQAKKSKAQLPTAEKNKGANLAGSHTELPRTSGIHD